MSQSEANADRTGRPQPLENLPPRPSSTVLLLRDSKNGIEVFMAERHAKSSAFAGALVFPGGTVDPADRRDGDDQDRPFPAALRRAAIREMFEETGFILAEDARTGAEPTAERAADIVERHHAAICAGEVGFFPMLEAEGLRPSLDGLVPFARWITPDLGYRRYDAHFFVAAAIEGQFGTHDGKELVSSIWITPDTAIQAGLEGRYQIVFPTRSQLHLLQPAATVIDALETARAREIKTVEPFVATIEGGRQIKILPGLGYEETNGDILPQR